MECFVQKPDLNILIFPIYPYLVRYFSPNLFEEKLILSGKVILIHNKFIRQYNMDQSEVKDYQLK